MTSREYLHTISTGNISVKDTFSMQVLNSFNYLNGHVDQLLRAQCLEQKHVKSLIQNIYYHQPTKFREGNVFTPVSQSFCSGGGIMPLPVWLHVNGGLHGKGVCIRGQGVCMQVARGGFCIKGEGVRQSPLPSTDIWWQLPKRALHILLECILI